MSRSRKTRKIARARARRVRAAGKNHASIGEAARALGVVPSTIVIRVERGEKGYAYIDPPTAPKGSRKGRPRKLTPANEIRVRLECVAGTPREDIAAKFGVSPSYVNYHCKGIGGWRGKAAKPRLDAMIRKCAKLGAPVREIADSANMSMAAVRRIVEGVRAAA